MKISHILEKQTRQLLDGFFARWPQSAPGKKRLQACKIIAHRGDYDNQQVFENTIEAFDRAKSKGVWGIEFDIRWTEDLQPVVIHDPDLSRVFGSALVVRQTTLSALKAECPLVPTLAEMIRKYGRQIHLMVEVKSERYRDPVRQNRTLEELFSPLVPGKDYHFLSMSPKMFERIHFAPESAFVPVARFDFIRLSKLAIEHNYAGIAGHYLLLTKSRLKRHMAFGQKTATGYVNSINCLFRELNRGVEWIFSDQAVKLQNAVNQLLQKG
jgi:glycerophosphoryl diester phosphodiesterase